MGCVAGAQGFEYFRIRRIRSIVCSSERVLDCAIGIGLSLAKFKSGIRGVPFALVSHFGVWH